MRTVVVFPLPTPADNVTRRNLRSGLGLTLAALFALSAHQAVAARLVHVNCGDVITENTVLDSDVTGPPNVCLSPICPCAGTGVVIGADQITLDLNGHLVAGQIIGVDNSDGHEGVTIQNGRIGLRSNSYIGIRLTGARGNTLRGLVLETINGIVLERSDNNDLEANVVMPAYPGCGEHGYGSGMSLDGDSNRVERNQVGNGIGLSGDHNVVKGNIGGPGAHPWPFAIRLSGNGNWIDSNEMPMYVAGNDNWIVRNVASNIEEGAEDCYFHSVISVQGQRNVLQANIANNNGFNGIATGYFSSAISVLGQRDIIKGNVANNNAHDGIAVESPQAVLSHNTANGNVNDGIEVYSPSTVLSHNTANDNGDLGVDAVAGVIDGGGNRASGNGNPLQTDFTCRASTPQVTVQSVTCHDVLMSWQGPSCDAARVTYSVWRCEGAGCSNFAQLATGLSGTALDDFSVRSGTAYSYKVQATDSTGSVSPFSSTVNVSVPSCVS